MAEKKLYSDNEVQTILKNAIEATSKGVFEFINNECAIVDKFYKIDIVGATLEINNSSKKNVVEYIDQELTKVGIIYKR